MNISNKNARLAVERMENFTGSHTFGEMQENGVYKVYSYGYHFPLYVNKGGQWYENKDRYSVTTSKHKSQLRPYASNMVLLSTEEMKAL